MNKEQQQGQGSDSVGMSSRTLKIEVDPWHDPVKPRIRLHGRWLERAGFKPGHLVEIRSPEDGTLTLRFVASATNPAS